MSQVLLQLVVVCSARATKKLTELSEGVGRGSRPHLSHFHRPMMIEYTARISRIKDGLQVSEQLPMVGEDLLCIVR